MSPVAKISGHATGYAVILRQRGVLQPIVTRWSPPPAHLLGHPKPCGEEPKSMVTMVRVRIIAGQRGFRTFLTRKPPAVTRCGELITTRVSAAIAEPATGDLRMHR